MQRLIYAPKAFIFVRTDEGVLNLSKYTTAGSVTRRVNAVSSATFQLRNPDMIFTAHDGKEAVFSPMDPITIYLQRLQKRPVRVFTGFLDETPYYELYPGVIELSASCTLKKLLYTYFDPALPYTFSFLQEYGWSMKDGSVFNPQAQAGASSKEKRNKEKNPDDGGMGNLLYHTLLEIGGWRDENIKIEKLPDDLIERMAGMAKSLKDSQEDVKEGINYLLEKLVGSGEFGSSGTASGSSPGSLSGGDNPEKIFNFFTDAGFSDEQAAGWVGNFQQESGCDPKAIQQGGPGHGLAQWGDGRWTALQSFAKGKNKPWDDLLTQLQFVMHELNGSESAAMGAIKAAKTVDDAVDAIGLKYERFGVAGERNGPAHEAFEKFGGKRSKDSDKEETGDADAGDTEGTFKTVRATSSSSSSKKGDGDSNSDGGKVYPLARKASLGGSPAEHKSSGRGGSWQNEGWDLMVPVGTDALAVEDGTLSKVHLGTGALTEGWQISMHGKSGEDYFYNLHGGSKCQVKTGQSVKAGDILGQTGDTNGPHLHFSVREGWPGNQDFGMLDLPPGKGQKGSGGTDGGSTTGSQASDAEIAARINATVLATDLNWATEVDMMEALALRGNKSLMNDKPLMPFIQQMAEGSLRQFMSMPNGDFFAFYPDYFGETWHRPPYWMIEDIEVLDGRVRLNDESLVTHQYIIGDTTFQGEGGLWNRLQSAGSVSIFNAFTSNWVVTEQDRDEKDREDKDKEDKKEKKEKPEKAFHAFSRIIEQDEAIAFLQRYGARPAVEDFAMIRNPFFELFLAYQKFMQSWARQFLTPFVFTFMPELYPGGKVGMPDHGLQMYIEEVTHTWDYESGFTTEAQFSSPAVMMDDAGKPMTNNLPVNMPTALMEKASKRGTDESDKTSRDVLKHEKIDRPALAPGANGEQRPT